MKRYRYQEFRDVMVELVKLFQPHTYVEVGIQRGYTLSALAPLVKRAVGVDVKDFPAPELPHVEKYVMTSAEFAEGWQDPIDLLFIDADHQKKAVLADFDALAPLVREGTGLIMLHDTHPINESLLSDRYCSNAWEAARAIHRNKKYQDIEIVTLPGPWAGLSICRKAKKHLAWK